MQGRLIQQYRIVSLLGEGGMGTVYRANDTFLERTVAIKMLHPHLLNQASFMERFRHEALILARLTHPNIAVVYNLLKDEADHFIVMEYVEGESLEKVIQTTGPLSPAVAAELVRQGLEGLSHAHRKGVFHRDIKPANLMITPEGMVKLMDFGIAKAVGEQRLTQANRLVGTLEYMAPELIQGQDPSPASDLYAMGILLYELLTGKLPFASRTDYELMQAIVRDKPLPIRKLNQDVPKELADVVQKALEKKPVNRFTDAKAFQSALKPFLSSLPAHTLSQLATRPAAERMTEIRDIQPRRRTGLATDPHPATAEAQTNRLPTRTAGWVRRNWEIFLASWLVLGALAFLGLIFLDNPATPLNPQPISSDQSAETSGSFKTRPFQQALRVTTTPKKEGDPAVLTPFPAPTPDSKKTPEKQNSAKRPPDVGKPMHPVTAPPEGGNEKPIPASPVQTAQSGTSVSEPTTTEISAPTESANLKTSRKSLLTNRLAVSLVLNNNISSREARIGQSVYFRVAEDVLSAGEVIIPAGATAYGEVTRVKRAGEEILRKKNLLEFRIYSVEAVHGQRIPLRSATIGDEAKEGPVTFRSGQLFEVRTQNYLIYL